MLSVYTGAWDPPVKCRHAVNRRDLEERKRSIVLWGKAWNGPGSTDEASKRQTKIDEH